MCSGVIALGISRTIMSCPPEEEEASIGLFENEAKKDLGGGRDTIEGNREGVERGGTVEGEASKPGRSGG